MPARIVKSLMPPVGRPHREHRSKRGRRKLFRKEIDAAKELRRKREMMKSMELESEL